MKTIESIINQIKVSEDLQKKLAEAAKNNTVADFLKEQGCEATADEFIAGVKAQVICFCAISAAVLPSNGKRPVTK